MRKIANDSDINRTRYIVAIQSLSPSIRERIVGRERGAFASSKTRRLVYRQQPSRAGEWVKYSRHSESLEY